MQRAFSVLIVAAALVGCGSPVVNDRTGGSPTPSSSGTATKSPVVAASVKAVTLVVLESTSDDQPQTVRFFAESGLEVRHQSFPAGTRVLALQPATSLLRDLTA